MEETKYSKAAIIADLSELPLDEEDVVAHRRRNQQVVVAHVIAESGVEVPSVARHHRRHLLADDPFRFRRSARQPDQMVPFGRVRGMRDA